MNRGPLGYVRQACAAGATGFGFGPTGARGGVVFEMGPIQQRVHADSAASMATSHPMGEALSAMALALAVSLDRGVGMQEAAVNRELRATLVDLARTKVGDDDRARQFALRPNCGIGRVRRGSRHRGLLVARRWVRRSG